MTSLGGAAAVCMAARSALVRAAAAQTISDSLMKDRLILYAPCIIFCRARPCETSPPLRHGLWREPRDPSRCVHGVLPFRDVRFRDAWRLPRDGGLHASDALMPSCGVRQLSSTWGFLTFEFQEAGRWLNRGRTSIVPTLPAPCERFLMIWDRVVVLWSK